MIGAVSVHSSRSTFGLISSRPAALCGFKFDSNLRIMYYHVLLLKHKTVSKLTAFSDISQEDVSYNCQICPFSIFLFSYQALIMQPMYVF